jgi:predicted homoserine dehydrogenase-like protein
MIIVDNALARLEKDGNPIRFALVGAGDMGRGIALQTLNYVKGIRVAAISNRTVHEAERAYTEAGAESIVVKGRGQLEDTIAKGQYAVTDNPFLLCQSSSIDAIAYQTLPPRRFFN